MSAPARIPADAPIASLRNQADEALRPVLTRDSQVALLDFPNHPNVGDSAIWAGEMAYLDSLGCGIVYRLRRAGLLARRAGEAHRQGHYLAARRREPRRPPDLQRPPQPHAGGRDHRSLDIARNEFRATSLLCPDMALCLGPLRRPGSPVADVVCLLRTDVESATSQPPAEAGSIETTDWLAEPPTVLTRTHDFLHRQLALYPRRLAPLRQLFRATYTPVARHRLAWGGRLLARGRVVVTDRLHGHLLPLLLGQPHVLLDNSYGKLNSFVQSWTTDCEITHWSDSIEDAVRMARALAS